MNNSIRLLAAVAVLAIMSSCGGGKSSDQKNTKNAPPVWVATELARKQDISSEIVITGNIKPNTTGTIKSPVNGIITELKVRENDWVNRGDVILIINPSERVTLIAKYNQELKLLRNKLTENGNDTDSIRMQIIKAEENLKFAETMYQKIPVTSEVAGRVSVRHVDKGSEVSAKDLLIEVFDPQSLVIKAEVNEKYFPIIKLGKVLPVKLISYPNEIFEGRITLVYPKVNEQTRSIMFDVTLNKKIELMEGMLAEITLTTELKQDVVSIPDDAIMSSHKNERFVFTVDADSIVHRHKIETGLSSGGFTEVVSGIGLDDKIVVKGQEVLKDGITVKITDTKKTK